MSTCYLGPLEAISPFGAGGAENLIRRRKEEKSSEKFYFLTDRAEYQLISPDGTLRKFRPKMIVFLYFLLMYRNKVNFSPVALNYKLRLILNILNILHVVKIERIVFNYPTDPWKLRVYFIEALLCSNKIFYLSNRQYMKLRKYQQTLPYVTCKYIFREKIEIPTHFKFNNAHKEGFVVTFIGRADVNKGIEEVIEIAELLRDEPDITMNICYLSGCSERDKALARRIDPLGEHKNVNIYPSVKNETDTMKNEVRVSKLLKTSHVFLQPYKALNSAIEAPLLLYEAQEAGCLIFTRDVAGIHEHLKGDSRFFSGDARCYAVHAVEELKKLKREQLD